MREARSRRGVVGIAWTRQGRAFDCDHPIGKPPVASLASAVAGTE